MNENESEDLSVAGPNSPVSLHKFIKRHDDELRKLTVLVDSTGMGIVKDDDSCVYITPEECYRQATYYLKEKFNGAGIPAYLYRYLSYMFIDDAPWYNTDADLVADFTAGKITDQSPNYLQVLGLIKYCDTNKEAAQVIGLIQLISGSLRVATQNKCGIRLYIEHPESSLHPKRCSRSMSMLMKLDNEYGAGTAVIEASE